MAKIAVDVLLVDGTNEETFISSFDDIPEVELKNRLPNSPTLLVLRVEESYISTLESDSRVVAVEIPPPVFEPIAPIHDSEEYVEQNKIIEKEIESLPKEPEGSDVKKEYNVTCSNKSDWDFIREELEKDGSIEDNIPTPNCHCFNECLQSDVRGGFLLTDNEADELRKNPKVINVHIETGAYPGTYPRFGSDFTEAKEYRYASTVKHQRDWDSSGITPSTPNKSLENRCSSHLKRHMQKAGPWQVLELNGTGDDSEIFDDRIQQHGTGKDVDIIVCDENVWFGHIEFQNDYDTNNNSESMTAPSNYTGGNVLKSGHATSATNGTCDVLDLVLDAPYYIDPAWFEADASNRLVVRWDGTTVPSESAAKSWWSNGSSRSSQFLNSGTVPSSTISAYTRLRCNGSNISRNTYSGTHGTPCMSQSYGRQYGWAYNANKWFLSTISSNSPSIEACFDMQKIFHQTKPNRPSDNTKNPTVSSNSWGFRTSPPSSGWYYFRPSAIDGTVTGVQFDNNDDNLPNRPAFLNYFTGDRANNRSPEFEDTGATMTAGKELVDAGVIFVCSAGNNSQKSVKSNHPDYNNYFADSSSTSYENSKKSSGYGSYINGANEYGSTSRRGFPAQIGIDKTTTPYTYKTITIGCIDDAISTTTGKERNVDYTNKGEGIDGWTQGDETLAAQSQSWGGYNRYDKTFTIAHGNDDNDSAQRDTSDTSNTTSLTSKDRKFDGTSSACPIAAGIIATVLETNRNWTFEDVRDWIKDDCGQTDSNNFYMGTEATTADSSDWADNNSAGGYAPDILWDAVPSGGGGGGGGGNPRAIPDYYSLTNKTLKTSSITGDGTNYISLQHYLDSDIIRGEANKTIGGHNSADDYQNFSGVTYKSRWTGKYVDIVTMEAGSVASYAGYQDTHPDFDNPDNTGNTRCVPMNWSGCEGASNNQVSTNSMFSEHGIGVLSAAGGIYAGFAKRASLRSCYLGTTGDSVTECFDAIKAWHNSKPNNSETGIKSPTIVIAEYQYLLDHDYAIKVEDVNSVTDPTGGTTSKPGGGWGSDLTPFTSRHIYPFRVKDPDDNSWHWMVTLPRQTQNSSLKTAMDQAWDAGIILINAAGNNGGVYVKENDARWSGTYIDITAGTTQYSIDWASGTTSITLTKGTTSTTRWYPLRAYGPHGHVKSIDVAAGQNSETHPILDGYSNRGPGIDITGLGVETYTSYPTVTDSNGHKWGFFSGTSCAAPTVVGKAACILEKYYTYHGSFPTPDKLKQMLLAQSKSVLKSVDSTTWNNVPTASDSNIEISESMSSSSVLKLKNGVAANGSLRLAELAGTPNRRAYWNAKGYKRRSTKGRRPFSGKVYPRRNNRIEKRS